MDRALDRSLQSKTLENALAVLGAVRYFRQRHAQVVFVSFRMLVLASPVDIPGRRARAPSRNGDGRS